MSRDGITRRNALSGAAAVGVGLPLLAACGGDEPATPTAARAAARTLRRPAAPAADADGRRRRRRADADVRHPGRRRHDLRRRARSSSPSRPRASSRPSPRSAPTRAARSTTSTDGTIHCACHGSQFSIEDGSATRRGPAPAPLAAGRGRDHRRGRPDHPGLTAARPDLVRARRDCRPGTVGLGVADPPVVPARTGVDPDPAGGLPVPRRQGPGHLRRQGQEPARPAVVVLPGHRQPAPAHRDDGHHRGQRRVDGRSRPRSRRSSWSTPGSRSSTRAST